MAAAVSVRLRSYPAMLGINCRTGTSHCTIRKEPLRSRLCLIAIAPWIAECRRIGMQHALSDLEVSTSDPKDVLVFRSLMVHTHVLGP
jgi:hypothetical protein